MAGQPGIAGSQFPSEDALIRRVQDLEKSVQQLAAANPFAPMGMTPNPDGVSFGGSVLINGNLSVPSGSISNDALQNPVQFGQSSTVSTNFALAVTETTFAPGSIPIPAGYTKAQVTVIAVAGALNPNATNDFLYATALINGSPSRQIFGYAAANNGSVEVMTAKVSFLTGLSGGNIDVAISLSTQAAAWASSGSNRAFVEASAIFLR